MDASSGTAPTMRRDDHRRLTDSHLRRRLLAAPGEFAEAKPGASGYFPINLTPGKYIYACFFPQGGKKDGKPHFLLGMEGSFTVS